MRLLAIGDIHGCSRALAELLDYVQPTRDDRVIALGDYVDRGPDSRGALDMLIDLWQSVRLTPLFGNHEQMMLEARDNPEVMHYWLLSGGAATLDSYAPEGRRGHFKYVPLHHWQFLETACIDWYETDHHIFVHGNVDPYTPMDEQTLDQLRWTKFDDAEPHISGKTLVCGHARQRSGRPFRGKSTICIDTWVYGTGWLTCLDARGGKYWQTNQLGERREGWIDDEIDNEPDADD